MDKSRKTNVVWGALIGGLVGAVFGAVMAARSSGPGRSRPSATEATAIGMTMLGLAKQLISAFS